nr:MAG TPA: hypothetical protein [Caudoviricetes sp.]
MCSHQEPLNEKTRLKTKKIRYFFGSNGFFVYLQCVEIRRDRVEVMTVYRPKVAFQRPYFYIFSSFNTISSAI